MTLDRYREDEADDEAFLRSWNVIHIFAVASATIYIHLKLYFSLKRIRFSGYIGICQLWVGRSSSSIHWLTTLGTTWMGHLFQSWDSYSRYFRVVLLV